MRGILGDVVFKVEERNVVPKQLAKADTSFTVTTPASNDSKFGPKMNAVLASIILLYSRQRTPLATESSWTCIYRV